MLVLQPCTTLGGAFDETQGRGGCHTDQGVVAAVARSALHGLSTFEPGIAGLLSKTQGLCEGLLASE